MFTRTVKTTITKTEVVVNGDTKTTTTTTETVGEAEAEAAFDQASRIIKDAMDKLSELLVGKKP